MQHAPEHAHTPPAGHPSGHETNAAGGPHPPKAKADAGHDRHFGHSVVMFRDKFWLSLALTIPVVVWSSDVQHWVGYTALAFPGSKFIPGILGTIVFLYGGIVFIRGAWGELSDHKPGMMTLISLAIAVAFIASFAATLGIFEVDVWWELATLITIMVLGHWLEMKAIAQARGALDALAALLPDTAERVNGPSVKKVPIAELCVDDVVLVRPGARIPADGIIVEGMADVDESMITGESRAIARSPGATVIAGTVATGSSLRVRVTAVGEKTALSGIMRLVATAQASGSRTQALADRAAALLFYVALASGVLTFTYWWMVGDKEHALIRTATVLIIACPHALGLAIPLVIAISTSIGAKKGLLVKDRIALERARNLDIVIFDKTGTLTRGSPALSGIASATGTSEEDVLALAATVEADSEHPIAKAIVTAGKKRGVKIEPSVGFEALPGRGAKAAVNGKTTSVGGPRLLGDLKAVVPPEIESVTRAWAPDGRTVLYVLVGDRAIGALAVEDEIRPESAEAVELLHKLGIRVAMITGDSQAVADSVARRLKIDEVAAQVLPADKASAVKGFQAGGKQSPWSAMV